MCHKTPNTLENGFLLHNKPVNHRIAHIVSAEHEAPGQITYAGSRGLVVKYSALRLHCVGIIHGRPTI